MYSDGVAYTQQQIDDLRAAIASGALSVGHGDKRIQYRSLEEMERALAKMEREVSGTTTPSVMYTQRLRRL